MKLFFTIFMIISHQQCFAQDIQTLIATCTACHGPQGVSANSQWPNLAGQKNEYLFKQLKDFKSFQRKDPIMNPIVQSLEENDMKKIAQYFESLK